jgi:hypothetical protein
MSMTQLIVGTALGFFVAQGVLYSIRHLIGWLQRSDARKRILKPSPSLGSAFIHAFIKYAAPVGAGVAVITLGVWAVGDHLAAKSARSAATADVFKPSTTVPASASHGSPDEVARPVSVSRVERPAAVATDNVDPYADPDFKVQRRPHRPGTALSLKETLLQRSEAKACAELLRETQQRLSRSQYDCEAADRAGKYLKAGLDVWGFTAWQIRHFPMDGYKGAMLPQCKDIKDIVDHSSSVDLQSTVAQQHHP